MWASLQRWLPFTGVRRTGSRAARPPAESKAGPFWQPLALRIDPPNSAAEREASTYAQHPSRHAPTRVATVDAARDADQPAIDAINETLSQRGIPLDPDTRAEHERRRGQTLHDVRVHVGAQADRSARAVDALAYTAGSNIVFRDGHYAPGTERGDALLAHELTHVAQQRGSPDGVIQRAGMGELRLFEAHEEQKARLRLDFEKAKKANLSYAKPTSLGWGTRLATVADGAYKEWADLWNAGDYNAFATAVGGFQIDHSFREKDTDGILGPATWYRIAGLGEAMASITKVTGESEYVCTIATKERIERGYSLATGLPFLVGDDKSNSTYHAILQTMPDRMLDIDMQYRATGAAGAMVYAGKATFVPEAEIWNGALRPGAVLQVWGSRADYDILRAGRIEENGKLRRLTDTDSFYGTSFVFVRYDPENPKRMEIRHYGRTEWKDSTDYEVWVAANVSTAEPR